MSLEHAILGFLAEGDRSGYEIKTRCIDGDAAHFWTADQAQVYRTLDRLERDRYVTSKRQRQSGRPDRKVYSLTRTGREALDAWLAEPHDVPPYRDPFLIQLYFASELPDDLLEVVLERAREQRQSRLDSLRQRAVELSRQELPTARRTALLRRMTLDAAIAEERSAIDWIDDSIETLHALSAGTKGQTRLFGGDKARGGAKR